MFVMDIEEKRSGPAGFERRVGVGIRWKLFGFLLSLVFLLIASATWMATEVTQATLRRDLIQRGAAVSRVVALSAGIPCWRMILWGWTDWYRKPKRTIPTSPSSPSGTNPTSWRPTTG
jgi:hypothetical protein